MKRFVRMGVGRSSLSAVAALPVQFLSVPPFGSRVRLAMVLSLE